MKEKMKSIKFILDDLDDSIDIYQRNIREYESYYKSPLCGDRKCGKTAIKRKITYLRQLLLELEKEVGSY